jgi:hypothetical protein
MSPSEMKSLIAEVADVAGYSGAGRRYQRYGFRRKGDVTPSFSFDIQNVRGIGKRTVAVLFIDIDEFESDWISYLVDLRLPRAILDDQPFGVNVYNLAELELPPYIKTNPTNDEVLAWKNWISTVLSYPRNLSSNLDEFMVSIKKNNIMGMPVNYWILNPSKLTAFTAWLRTKKNKTIDIDLPLIKYRQSDWYSEIDMNDWIRYMQH